MRTPIPLIFGRLCRLFACVQYVNEHYAHGTAQLTTKKNMHARRRERIKKGAYATTRKIGVISVRARAFTLPTINLGTFAHSRICVRYKTGARWRTSYNEATFAMYTCCLCFE